MLSVSKLSTKQGGPKSVLDYLLEQLLRHRARNGMTYTTGYYTSGAPSEWAGSLAAEQDLSGEVDTDVFERLLGGQMPDGAPFANPDTSRRMGNDLTFSAPKSVSIEALALGNEALMRLHDAAVQDALAYLESHVISARYGPQGIRSEKTGSALFAVFRHEDARPVDGVIQPQLHSHAIALNVTRGSQGDLRALDLDFGSEAIRMHIADAIYKASLAQRCEAAGMPVRQTADGFELAHISDAQIAEFSSRSHQIEAELAKSGLSRETSNARQRTNANFATRLEKASRPHHALRVQWRAAAREAAIQPARRAAVGPSADISQPGYSAARVAVDYALAHLSERYSVLDSESVYLEAVLAGIGQAGPEAIETAIDNHEGIYHVGAGQIVTDATLATERRVINTAGRLRNTKPPLYSHTDAAARIRHREASQGMAYSAGQRRALQLALTSPDQVVGVVGAAGVGKTLAMQSVSDEASAAGYEIVGVAPSEVAARQLEDARVDQVDTLAAYQLRARASDSPPRYIILDEAGMVSLRDMDGLLSGLRADDRLMIVGDPSQLQPVEAGTPFSQIMDEGAIDYREITEVRRQHDPRLLEMANAFAAGRTGDAIDIVLNEYTHVVTPRKNKDYKVTRVEKREAIVEEVARRWLARDAERRAHTIIQVGTNETRHALNARIRAGLIAEGAVDPEQSQVMTALSKTTLTRSQQSDARYYQTGQIVRMRESRSLRDYTITRVDTRQNTIEIRDRQTGDCRTERVDRIRGRLYNAAEMEVAVGDRVLFQASDRRLGVSNGDGGVVRAVDADGIHVALERLDASGDPVEVDIGADQAVALDYGYARTVHKSQGVTARESIVAGEAGRMATAEQGHVAATRVRETLEVVTDDTDKLRRSWLRHADKTTARQAVSAAKQPRPGEALEEARRQRKQRQLSRESGPSDPAIVQIEEPGQSDQLEPSRSSKKRLQDQVPNPVSYEERRAWRERRRRERAKAARASRPEHQKPTDNEEAGSPTQSEQTPTGGAHDARPGRRVATGAVFGARPGSLTGTLLDGPLSSRGRKASKSSTEQTEVPSESGQKKSGDPKSFDKGSPLTVGDQSGDENPGLSEQSEQTPGESDQSEPEPTPVGSGPSQPDNKQTPAESQQTELEPQRPEAESNQSSAQQRLADTDSDRPRFDPQNPPKWKDVPDPAVDLQGYWDAMEARWEARQLGIDVDALDARLSDDQSDDHDPSDDQNDDMDTSP